MSKGFNFKTKPTTVSTTKPTATPPAATTTPTQFVFDALPDSAWLRESQLVRSPKNPDSAIAPLPFSAPTLWRKVKDEAIDPRDSLESFPGARMDVGSGSGVISYADHQLRRRAGTKHAH